ncbi:hypothetical protein GBA52_020740 [Prunus armeniaca]|nr:hypothetical protein GBA52_020740 [Prunus armeniaca]
MLMVLRRMALGLLVLEAELWGLFFVLEVAVGKGISKIIVEMDSATAAVHLIQQLVLDTLHPLAAISNQMHDN